MENKYYLRIQQENDSFGFVLDGVHSIQETDIGITNEDYHKFFELQSEGKQFRLKETLGKTLFDCVEEFIPEVDNTPQRPTQEARINALEELILTML